MQKKAYIKIDPKNPETPDNQSDEETINPNPLPKTPWYKKLIPKIESNSKTMAILILINTTMGSALLALPHAIAHFGYIPGILMLFISAANIRISLKYYSLILRRYKCGSFSEMAKKGLNSAWGGVVNYVFSFYVWGTLTGYILVSKSMIELVSDGVFVRYYGQGFLAFKERFGFLYFFVPACICLPFNFLGNCDRLKGILKFGVFIVFFLAFVLFVETPEFIQNTKIDYKMFDLDMDHILQSYGNFIYSFNALVNIFIMKNNLKNPTKERLSSIFNRVVIIILIFYLTISISGYLSLGQNSVKHDLIIERESIFKNDLLMKFSILRFIKSLFIPNSYRIHNSRNPFKITIFHSFQNSAFFYKKYFPYSYFILYSFFFSLVLSALKKTFFFTWIFFCNFYCCYSTWDYFD